MARVRIDAWTIHDIDNTVFDNMYIPVGADRTIAAETIMRETRGLNVIDNEPVRFKKMIESWSRQRIFVWTRLFKTLNYQYNPIENYDRIEEHVDRHDHIDTHSEKGTYDKNGSNTGNIKDVATRNGTSNDSADDSTIRTPKLTTDVNGNTSTESNSKRDTNRNENLNSTVTDNVWGFNESEMAPSKQVVTESSGNMSENSVENSSGNDTSHSTTVNTGTEKTDFTHNGNASFDENENLNRDEMGNFNEDGTDSRQHENNAVDFNATKIRAHGNIGVTTTQQMIQQERDIALFDLYKFIADDFKSEFCIMVY